MTAIDITYEDGLRLSELYGQLAGLKYEADNLLIVNVGDLAVVGILLTSLAAMISLVIFILTVYCRSWRYVAIAMPFIIPIAGMIVLYISIGAGVDIAILETQSQIDAILAKYEGTL